MSSDGGASEGLEIGPAEPWVGLSNFPGATQSTFKQLLDKLKQLGRDSLNVLVIGRPGVGKSSLCNSVFNEKVAQVSAFAPGSSEVAVCQRQAAGFTLRMIDTPGLSKGDHVNDEALQSIAYAVRSTPIDVVFFVDRFDLYKPERLDGEVLQAVSDTFGRDIWDNSFLVLTRANMKNPPNGIEWSNFAEARAGAIRKQVKKAGGHDDIPVLFVENSDRCDKDAHGQKILPDDTLWLCTLMACMVDAMEKGLEPYEYDGKGDERGNPDRRRRWLIPLLIVAQVAFKFLVLDKLSDEDACTGDQFGPFDKETAAQRRKEMQEEKAERERREQARKSREAQMAKARAAAAAAAAASSDSDDESGGESDGSGSDDGDDDDDGSDSE
ncbi:unnamed protein product [Pedinophyceae sp. YPF-701]|nr:unnamed protein product [Pedinophyceae sp. YPF-701]